MGDLVDAGSLVAHAETSVDIRERLTSITMSAWEHCLSVSVAAGACALAIAIYILYR